MGYLSSMAATMPVGTWFLRSAEQQSPRTSVAARCLLSSEVTAAQPRNTYRIERWTTATPGTAFYGDACSDLFLREIDSVNGRKLSHQLRVFVEPDGKAYLAQSNEFEQVHGAGDTVEDALEDFESSLLELYEDLSDTSVPYSAEWRAVRDRLNQLIG